MTVSETRSAPLDRGAPDVLFSAGQIAARIEVLADEIAENPVIAAAARTARPGSVLSVCALRGGFMFAADLLRALSARRIDPDIGFVQAASYGAGTVSSGQVQMVRELKIDIGGRPVLLIDDILDSGRTLVHLESYLKGNGAADVISAVLLDKPARRAVPAEADYVGFTCPDAFVVGYGMDAAGRYRGLPYVGLLPGASVSPPSI